MRETIKITKNQFEELRDNYVLEVDDREIHLTYGCNFICEGRFIDFEIRNKIITSLDDYDKLFTYYKNC